MYVQSPIATKTSRTDILALMNDEQHRLPPAQQSDQPLPVLPSYEDALLYPKYLSGIITQPPPNNPAFPSSSNSERSSLVVSERPAASFAPICLPERQSEHEGAPFQNVPLA